MTPYCIEVVCDICGEEGLCRPRDAGSQWLGGTLSHSNPAVCAENLRRQKEREDDKTRKIPWGCFRQ